MLLEGSNWAYEMGGARNMKVGEEEQRLVWKTWRKGVTSKT